MSSIPRNSQNENNVLDFVTNLKISKVNSTVRLCGGIYSYMSGV